MNTATLTQIENNNLTPRRTSNGGLVPVIGTPIATPYGDAVVVGYDDGNLKVEITDYNEDVVNVDEIVASLAQGRNRGLNCLIETIKRCDTGTIKAIRERIESVEDRYYNDLQFRFQPSPSTEFGLGTLFQIEPQVTVKETPSERIARQRAERKRARQLANELLADDSDVIPSDIAEEMAEVFGD